MHYHLKLVESGEGNFDFTRELLLPTPALVSKDMESHQSADWNLTGLTD